jgi:hypothetical protein
VTDHTFLPSSSHLSALSSFARPPKARPSSSSRRRSKESSRGVAVVPSLAWSNSNYFQQPQSWQNSRFRRFGRRKWISIIARNDFPRDESMKMERGRLVCRGARLWCRCVDQDPPSSSPPFAQPRVTDGAGPVHASRSSGGFRVKRPRRGVIAEGSDACSQRKQDTCQVGPALGGTLTLAKISCDVTVSRRHQRDNEPLLPSVQQPLKVVCCTAYRVY